MKADAPKNFAGRRLVVFGAGYIGAEVARQAVARGLRVTALTRNADKARALAAAGVEVVLADLATPEWHEKIEGGADFVLNSVSSGGGGVEGYTRSYVLGMRSVLAWVAREGGAVGTVVYTSSTSVYPQGGGVRVDETASTEGAKESALILLEAEKLLLAAAGLDTEISPISEYKPRAFILRLAGIYGPGRHHLLDQLRGGATELAGRGDHRLNLAHRDDIVAAVWASFAAPTEVAGGVFNVADDGAATKAEVVAWLAARLGVPVPRFTGEAAAGRRAVVPDRLIANEKIKRVLGWRQAFPTFREGYAEISS
jgi:nucleoside-diphosphate-sugar epimerase